MAIEDAHEIESAIISDGTKVKKGDWIAIRHSYDQTPEQIEAIWSEGDGGENGPCIITDSWGCYPSSFRKPRAEEMALLGGDQ